MARGGVGARGGACTLARGGVEARGGARARAKVRVRARVRRGRRCCLACAPCERGKVEKADLIEDLVRRAIVIAMV